MPNIEFSKISGRKSTDFWGKTADIFAIYRDNIP